MTRRRTVGALACLATVPVLLAGCSSAQQASQTLPTTTPPAAASATASPTLPPLGPADFPEPAAARQKTPDGVTAFTDYYIQLSNHLLSTLDSEPLRAFSRNCADCDSLASGYERAKAAGYRSEGGFLTVTSTGTAAVNGDAGDISFVLHQDPITVRDSSGAAVPTMSSGAFDLTGGLTLIWDTQRATWLVTQFTADRL